MLGECVDRYDAQTQGKNCGDERQDPQDWAAIDDQQNQCDDDECGEQQLRVEGAERLGEFREEATGTCHIALDPRGDGLHV